MAQAKRKRKHRGNAAGIVERPAHNATGRARKAPTKQDARAIARQKRIDRMNQPPTWSGAAKRAAIAAGLFAVLAMVVLKSTPASAIGFAAFMLVVYIPLSYMTDRALYNWRQKKKTQGQRS